MINLLKSLCTAKGVSGREEKVCSIIKDEILKYTDNAEIDKNNNVIYTWDAKDGHGFYPVLLPPSNRNNN